MKWQEKNNHLHGELTLKSFVDAVEFVRICSIEIEKLQHHPNICIRYNKVYFEVTTHDAGNTLTIKDYDLAKIIFSIALEYNV